MELFTHGKMWQNFCCKINIMYYRWVFVFKGVIQLENYFLLLEYVFSSKCTGNDSTLNWALIEKATLSKIRLFTSDMIYYDAS
jgi:hypothetical protein